MASAWGFNAANERCASHALKELTKHITIVRATLVDRAQSAAAICDAGAEQLANCAKAWSAKSMAAHTTENL